MKVDKVSFMLILKKLTLFAFIFAAITSHSAAEVAVYKIDPVHSGITFKVKHFINMVPGAFTDFSGEVHFDKAHPENSKIVATINPASINTHHSDRDDHLRNPDFFDIDEHEKITFESKEWEVIGDNKYKITGHLTLLGQTHPQELTAYYLGEVVGRGVMRSGWKAEATIDRTRWGMNYGVSAGVLGGEIDVELNIQAHLQ